MTVIDGQIGFRREIARDTYHVTIDLSRELGDWRPGQFVMIRMAPAGEPVLPRPFSIYRTGPSTVELVFRSVGRGTALIATLPLPLPVTLWGPLGVPFPETTEAPVIVGGGLGVVPLVELVRRTKPRRLFAGFRSRDEAILLDEIGAVTEPVVSTDDGTLGLRGFVTDAFESYIAKEGSNGGPVFACGPEPFLRAMAAVGRRRSCAIYGSFETRMACGFGVCLGCAIETPRGTVKVCKDGPVFRLDEVFG